jgi:hypothetical protein
MTTSAIMRSMFEHLGLTPGAVWYLEGNDTLEEAVFLNDNAIDSLVKQLPRPGGGGDCWT